MTPLQPCDAELPPSPKTALEIVNEIRAQKKLGQAEKQRFDTLSFAENRTRERPVTPAPAPRSRA
jgi:hypothetical protein